MNTLWKPLSVIVVGLLASGSVSSAFAHEAKVRALTGSAEVQLPGESTFKALSAQMMIPEGSTITVAPRARLLLEIYPGAQATIMAGSTMMVERLSIEKAGGQVTSQEAVLDLKKGTIVSNIDPAGKAINHYGIHTPRGIVAAHGTVFAVSVTTSGTTVDTLQGTVTMDLGGGQTVTIPVGTELPQDSQNVQTSMDYATLQQMVQVVADYVGNGLATDQNTAVNLLVAVVMAASRADPAHASDFAAIANTAAPGNSSVINAAAAAGGTEVTTGNTTPLTPLDVNQISNSGG